MSDKVDEASTSTPDKFVQELGVNPGTYALGGTASPAMDGAMPIPFPTTAEPTTTGFNAADALTNPSRALTCRARGRGSFDSTAALPSSLGRFAYSPFGALAMPPPLAPVAGVLGPSTANMAVSTPSYTPGRLTGKTSVFGMARTATRQAQQERKHETGGPSCQELKGKAATIVGMHMPNYPSSEFEEKAELARIARKRRLMESISTASKENTARVKELLERTWAQFRGTVEQIYDDTNVTNEALKVQVEDRDAPLSMAEELHREQLTLRDEELKRAKIMCQIPEADARPACSAVSAEMESLKADLQRTLTALKESEASRRNVDNLLKETRKAADATQDRLLEAEEECSASHAERDHACANLKALQDSWVEAKGGARISQQVAKEAEENTGMKGLRGHTVVASCGQNQTDQNKSKDEARYRVNGGFEVTPNPSPAERIGYSAATPPSALGNFGNLVRVKTIPIPTPARSLESPSPAQAPLMFGIRQRRTNRQRRFTPTTSSTSDATGGLSFSAEPGATLASTTTGRAFTLGGLPGTVGGTPPQAVTAKPALGGVVGLPSPAFSMATPVQQHQWNGHRHPETAMSLPSTFGRPRDTSAIPEDRLASLPSAQAQEATQSARSQSSTNAKQARERFGNGAVDAAGTSGSVAQGGATATEPAISGAGEAQLGNRGGAVDAPEGNVTRRVDLQEGGHTVILLDLETTGFSPLKNRVLQLAAKVMDSQDLNHSFSAYVKSGAASVPAEIQELTGITPQVLAENNAEPFPETWARFALWLAKMVPKGPGGGLVMVAHNASFDHAFVVSELVRAGLDRFTMGKLGIVAFVDSLAVLRDGRMWRQRPKTFKLGGIFKHLFGREMPGAHTALGDIQGLERILSAPGIAERWKFVASTHPACQISESRSRIEHDAAQRRIPKDESPTEQKPTPTKKGVGVPPDE